MISKVSKKVFLLGVALLSYAFAGQAIATDCGSGSVTPTANSWDCVDYQDATSGNYVVASTGSFLGPDGTSSTSFTFNGTSTLSAGSSSSTCTLILEGQVLNDLSSNQVGIKVVDGNVGNGPGSLCPYISVSGFPWYADDGTSFTSTSRVSGTSGGDVDPPDSGQTSANIGSISVSAPFVSCTGYVEDVIFENSSGSGAPQGNDSQFTFNGPLEGTDCSVSGTLTSVTGEDVNAW